MKSLGILTKVILLIILISNTALAGGTTRTPLFGARSAALNGLYFAGIDGISNVFLNPAGLAYCYGSLFQISGFVRSEQQKFNGDINGLYRSMRDDDPNAGAGIHFSISDQITFGLALEAVYDFRVNWPFIYYVSRNNIAYTIGTDMYYQNFHYSITPAIGINLGDMAVGLAVNLFKIESKTAFIQGNYNWTDDITDPAYEIDFTQSGYAWNANFGLMYNVNENLRLGLNLSNGINSTIDGEAIGELYNALDSAETKVNIESNYQTPWRIGLGCVYKLSDILQLNMDVRYNLYGSMDDQISYSYNNTIWETNSAVRDTITGFSAKALPLNYENSFDFGIGMEYKAFSDVILLFGYRFSQSPNSEQTYSLLNPTVDHHSISAGFVYEYENILVEGSVVYYRGSEKIINNAEYELHNGKYNADGLIPTFTLKYKL